MKLNIKVGLVLISVFFCLVGCEGTAEQHHLLDDHTDTSPSVSVQVSKTGLMAAGPLNDSRNWEFLTVMPSKLECEGYEITNCLVVMDSGGDEITYFYDLIEGFDYEWGYEYKLMVDVVEIDSPLMDAPSVRYELINTVSKSDYLAGSTFDYIARYSHRGLEKRNASEYTMIDGEILQCDQSTCDTVGQLLEQQMSIVLTLQHGPTPQALKTLVSVDCADSGDSFTTNCLSEKEVYRHD